MVTVKLTQNKPGNAASNQITVTRRREQRRLLHLMTRLKFIKHANSCMILNGDPDIRGHTTLFTNLFIQRHNPLRRKLWQPSIKKLINKADSTGKW